MLVAGDASVIQQTGVNILCSFDPEAPFRLEEREDLTEERVFGVKSLEVIWEGKPSFMHVLIDSTDILKLEEANNNIKCQKIMFTSISHELRTPLNAISNCYFILSQKLLDILNKIKNGDTSQ